MLVLVFRFIFTFLIFIETARLFIEFILKIYSLLIEFQLGWFLCNARELL